MAQPAALSLEGDPRMSASGPGIAQLSTPALRNLHDPSVTIEEYFYWAKITREEQRNIPTVKTPARKLLSFGKHDAASTTITGTDPTKSETSQKVLGTATDEKTGEPEAPANVGRAAVTEDEWLQASRAARTATWGSVFYLITTDILGPYSVPYAKPSNLTIEPLQLTMRQLGFGANGIWARYRSVHHFWSSGGLHRLADLANVPQTRFRPLSYENFWRHCVQSLWTGRTPPGEHLASDSTHLQCGSHHHPKRTRSLPDQLEYLLYRGE